MGQAKFVPTTNLPIRFPEDGPIIPTTGALLDEDDPLVVRRMREGLIAPVAPGVEVEDDPEIEEQTGEVEGTVLDADVPLEQMSRDQLLAIAREWDLEVPGNASKKALIEAIEAATAPEPEE